jgi:hypothetical protein
MMYVKHLKHKIHAVGLNMEEDYLVTSKGTTHKKVSMYFRAVKLYSYDKAIQYYFREDAK